MFSGSPVARRASPPRIGALVCGGLGLLLMLSAAAWGGHSDRFRRNATRAAGAVIRIEARSFRDSKRRTSVSYSPVVRFRAADGREVEFTGLGSNPPGYREGDPVTVLYDPARPSGARIESFRELWLGPLSFAAFGLLFTGAGLLLWRLKM